MAAMGGPDGGRRYGVTLSRRDAPDEGQQAVPDVALGWRNEGVTKQRACDDSGDGRGCERLSAVFSRLRPTGATAPCVHIRTLFGTTA
jgi:hypothetical protein